MARICELTGKRPMKGSIIWRSGKSKKSGGIGTHVTAITKRRFIPNLQRVKALIDGEVRYIRVTDSRPQKGARDQSPEADVEKGSGESKGLTRRSGQNRLVSIPGVVHGLQAFARMAGSI